ncbi:uncharacterized protein SPAPADRAFT_62596 [Spathaspora passalidarum NRRL Y-27907]|uniref:Uncharacterized protein n=1 Tax=Spathaspora passalidarum (strain NRRL Y-27907 / 11-Y1) TaxID=619300 RepID=G3ASV6_SPAPN|nr:uncharacterized protein SPAPADRAFT_62596 [Spathaspora passalidarum NRRL Y-27907]EGW30738.1 hypothetical protein SPAPADRAFT_62596 [Spathaspora passalidarum NRRL Y-27907]
MVKQTNFYFIFLIFFIDLVKSIPTEYGDKSTVDQHDIVEKHSNEGKDRVYGFVNYLARRRGSVGHSSFGGGFHGSFGSGSRGGSSSSSSSSISSGSKPKGNTGSTGSRNPSYYTYGCGAQRCGYGPYYAPTAAAAAAGYGTAKYHNTSSSSAAAGMQIPYVKIAIAVGFTLL